METKNRIRFSEISFNKVAKTPYDDTKPVIIAFNKNAKGLLKNYCNIEEDLHASYKYNDNGFMTEINLKSRQPLDDFDETMLFNPFVYTCYNKRLSKKFGEFYNMKLYLDFNFRDTFTDFKFEPELKTITCCLDEEFKQHVRFIYNKYGVLESIEGFESKLKAERVDFNIEEADDLLLPKKDFCPIGYTNICVFSKCNAHINKDNKTIVYDGIEIYRNMENFKNNSLGDYSLHIIRDGETNETVECCVMDNTSTTYVKGSFKNYGKVCEIKFFRPDATIFRSIETTFADNGNPVKKVCKTINDDGSLATEVVNEIKINDIEGGFVKDTYNDGICAFTETYNNDNDITSYSDDDYHEVYQYDDEGAVSLIIKYYGREFPEIRKNPVPIDGNKKKKKNKKKVVKTTNTFDGNKIKTKKSFNKTDKK